ncbi:MAG: hypothetical protein Q9226_001995 [Calogaya cf. arnoldii]
MTIDVKSIYHVDNDTMIGYHYNWPVEEIAHSETMPLSPMPSEVPWVSQLPQLDGPLYFIFKHVTALISVVLFCFALCRWSQCTKICPTPRATFEEQLHQKDAELARVNALNDDYTEIVESTNGQRALEHQELKEVTKELQWFCVNYPTLERANTDLQGKIVQLEEIKDELDESRNETCDLRKRLTKLTASLPPTPIHTSSVGKVRAGGLRDISEGQTQFEVTKGQGKDAVADKLKAEAERDQALFKEKKAVEESSRTATNLRILTESSDQKNLEYEKKIADLGSTIDALGEKVKNLESEKASGAKGLESSVANSKFLQSTVDRLEKELKESKDDVKNTQDDARSSLEKDAMIQARDTTIGQLEGKIQTLEQQHSADFRTWNNSKEEYENKIRCLEADLATCKSQYDAEYNHKAQVLQDQKNDLAQKLKEVEENHGKSAHHVNHLKHILGGVMRKLGVEGFLDSPEGLAQVERGLGHNLGQLAGYRSVLNRVMEESGIVGDLNNPDKLGEIVQEFEKFFNSFAPMRLTPRVIKSMQEELTKLQEFKAHMLASQSEGQTEDPAVKLRQAQAKSQLLWQDLNKAKNDASEKQKTIMSLRVKVKELEVLKQGNNRAIEADRAKLDQLKKTIMDLESEKGKVTQEVENLKEEVKKLEKRKLQLEDHKKKLLHQCQKAKSEDSKPEKQSPGAEKRSHGNGADSDAELPRSAKQTKTTISSRGNGVS